MIARRNDSVNVYTELRQRSIVSRLRIENEVSITFVTWCRVASLRQGLRTVSRDTRNLRYTETQTRGRHVKRARVA